MKLSTLADVRHLIEKHLPERYRRKATGRHVSTQLAEAAQGEKDLLEVCVSLHLVLALKACDAGGSDGLALPVAMEVRRSQGHACLIVTDATGFPVAYVYYEKEAGRRTAAGLMTRDEARRIAANIAKIPQYRLGDASS